MQNPMQSALKETEESSHDEITALRETNEQLKERSNENGTSGRIYMQRFLVVVLIISSVCIVDLLVAYYFMDLGENNTIHIDLDVMDSANAKYQLQSQDSNMGAIHIEGNFNVNFNPLLSEPHVNSVFCDVMRHCVIMFYLGDVITSCVVSYDRLSNPMLTCNLSTFSFGKRM